MSKKVILQIGATAAGIVTLFGATTALTPDSGVRTMREAQEAISKSELCKISKNADVHVQRYLYINHTKQGKTPCTTEK